MPQGYPYPSLYTLGNRIYMISFLVSYYTGYPVGLQLYLIIICLCLYSQSGPFYYQARPFLRVPGVYANIKSHVHD
jgi:hypothetical protein